MSPLSSAARRWLLEQARAAVEAAGRRQAYLAAEVPHELGSEDRRELERPKAAFVSLHKHGKLRGCVGHVAFDTPLKQVVAEMAQAAALDDTRFPPVSASEVPDLEIEISVLSSFFPIRPEEVTPGVHGLAVRQGWRRGLLLPQVATAQQWDAKRFLSETCRKAGLEPEAWKHGAELEGFTAEVIGERDDL